MLEVLIHEAEQFRVVAAFWVSVHGPVLVGARSDIGIGIVRLSKNH